MRFQPWQRAVLCPFILPMLHAALWLWLVCTMLYHLGFGVVVLCWLLFWVLFLMRCIARGAGRRSPPQTPTL